MLPSAILQTVASLLVPRMSRWVQPSWLVSGGLALAVLGFVALMMVESERGLGLMILGTILLGVGVMPMMILGTDLVISSVPPEKTGAAAATSETATELGMAMGIAVIGSVGAAVYRSHMMENMPGGLEPDQIEIATDTLGGALGIVQHLPAAVAEPLLAVVQAAFAGALHANALIGAGIMTAAAILTAVFLREVRVGTGGH